MYTELRSTATTRIHRPVYLDTWAAARRLSRESWVRFVRRSSWFRRSLRGSRVERGYGYAAGRRRLSRPTPEGGRQRGARSRVEHAIGRAADGGRATVEDVRVDLGGAQVVVPRSSCTVRMS